MSKPVVIENPSKLKGFQNTQSGMSCAVTGQPIPVGANIYALNADDARNGKGICEAEFFRLTPPAPAQVETPVNPEGSAEKTPAKGK